MVIRAVADPALAGGPVGRLRRHLRKQTGWPLTTRRFRLAPLMLTALLSGGCATFGYYAQAVGGQMELARSARPVPSVLADPKTPPALRDRLALAGRVVEFSRSELGFDSGGGYRNYVDLDRPYVVWNLFAAPPLSLQGRQWCYPVVGCVPYRGFFSRRHAEGAAARLARNGFETHLTGVPAYSSLGWFDDPLLSTFIGWPEARLVELLVHEIAHRRVWVRDDAAFNEAFAEFTGAEGARRWFVHHGRAAEFAAYRASEGGWQRLRALLLATRERLDAVYGSGGDERQRYREKARVLESFRRCYREHESRLGGGSFDHLVDGVNNAYLVALGAYTNWRPAFAALYRQAGDWVSFLEEVDVLADLEADERAARLHGLKLESADQSDVPGC